MKQTQRESNPFPHSDSNKRYYAYEYWLRQTFGGKCAKIPLDIGLTCPNIDGRCGRGGCIYCSGRGSGDCALTPDVPLAEQYRQTREALGRKVKIHDSNRKKSVELTFENDEDLEALLEVLVGQNIFD